VSSYSAGRVKSVSEIRDQKSEVRSQTPEDLTATLISDFSPLTFRRLTSDFWHLTSDF